MKTENLSLSSALDDTRAGDVARVINSINGVVKVAITAATGMINISFDDDVTSLQEVRTSLQRAGFSVKRGAHEEGLCCGSCGS